MSERDVAAVILYVEDNTLVRESVADVLESPQREFVCCADVASALAVLDQRAVDLVITDLNLPGTPGLALVQAIVDRDIACPIAICSGHDLPRTAFDEHPGVVFVRKPFELDEFEALIDRLLGAKGGDADRGAATPA